MNCPDCGAELQWIPSRHHFRCGHCGGFSFPEETGDGVSVVGEPMDGTCPVCQVPLQTAHIEREDVAYCGRCRGFLTGTASFGRIVTKRRAKHSPHEERADPFDPAELERTIRCPNCRERMEAHPYFGGGNAVVDTCEYCCLIWLDAGELAIIERYIPHTHRIEPALNLTGDSSRASMAADTGD